jgi:hypothetical protein
MIDIEKANSETVTRMMDAQPVLVGLGRADQVIPGMAEDLLLHAGPTITWERASGPMRGAITGALIFEGKAKNELEARALIESGQIKLAPCHHHQAVGPMAGVTSASMMVYIVENKTHGNKAFSNLNEGYGKVLRYGAYSREVISRLQWLNEVLGPMLAEALALSSGIDLKALIAEALQMGDEGHNRNKAGSILFLKALAPYLAQVTGRSMAEAVAATASTGLPLGQAKVLNGRYDDLADVLRFIGDNALSVLNPVMAACKAMAQAGHGIEGSTIVTTMARNGTDFGLRVSGLGEQWFTGPVAQPKGLYFPNFTAADGSGDIGDSTITETAGIGAFAMAAAPAIITFVSGTPKDAVNTTLEMYEINYTEHKNFTIPALDFRGTPTGIDIRKVVETGITPRLNTGIAHKEAGVGQIGAGLVRPPMEIFEAALVAFAEKYNI